MIKMAKRDSLK